MKQFILIFNSILFALNAASVSAGAVAAPPGASLQLPAGTRANPPLGWSDFCLRYPGECVNQTFAPETTFMTPKLWSLLNEINRSVNKSVEAITEIGRAHV